MYTTNHFQQCRLTCTVSAHQPDSLPFFDHKGNIINRNKFINLTIEKTKRKTLPSHI